MTIKRRIAFALIGVALIAGALVLAFQRTIGERVFASAVAQRLAQNDLQFGPGLHLVLCGTGSPLPNPDRAGPCNLVVAGEQSFVVDIGEGGARNLNLMGYDIGSIDGLLLTHYHSDHVDGIGPLALLYWTIGTARAPLDAYGPTGIAELVEGFNAAYALDHAYRVAHHGPEIVPASGGGLRAVPFEVGDEPVIVLERGGLTITAFPVEHDPVRPAIGYRFDYQGRSLVISGDTSRSSSLEAASQGADLLVHDALQGKLVGTLTEALDKSGARNTAQITRDILDYHASPEDAAASAQTAGVKYLVLSHLVPPIPNAFLYPSFLGDAESKFDGEIIVGEDGMIFTLPPESEAIERRKVL
ncbi:MBL fold metallo-hydrolase [Erythrobacter sp. JK5]|uniref:MBL fold metallo-hydrolase n=1 Tax=Erythrobacter sp. JK5 TaxID=2829500 RepID=UPI001BA8E4E2|nr:MBL fold metallo-hydrolase [Erythrobacter sp. JK5]QUL39123.1 MBL fold metallo-hydrolase [Erythrobacter sp. JK5]